MFESQQEIVGTGPELEITRCKCCFALRQISAVLGMPWSSFDIVKPHHFYNDKFHNFAAAQTLTLQRSKSL